MEPKYNKTAVDKQLAKNKVTKPKSKKLTHRLLKGRQKTDEGKPTLGAAVKRADASRQRAIRKAKRWMKTTRKDAAAAAKEFDISVNDLNETKMKKTVKEAVEKIACTKCDEVSTKAAWKKNDGTCPKCNNSTQGVAEGTETSKPKYGVFRRGGSIGDATDDPVSIHDDRDEAKAKATRLRKQLSPGEKKHYGISYVTRPIKEAKLTEGVLDDMDDDGFMAKRQLYDLAKNSVALHKLIQDTDNLEPWIQAKITKANDYILTVNQYMEYKNVRDADETADIMGPPDMADMDVVGDEIASLGPVEEQETIIEDGADLDGWDILRMANSRGLISPETYEDPPLELFNGADWFAQELGSMEEFGSSDISIWMKQFAEEMQAIGIILDGENSHLYESEIKAKSIYKNMLKDLRKSK